MSSVNSIPISFKCFFAFSYVFLSVNDELLCASVPIITLFPTSFTILKKVSLGYCASVAEMTKEEFVRRFEEFILARYSLVFYIELSQ